MPFFIIFICIPLAELMLFLKVGETIGLFSTLACAFLTALIGGMIVKHQGIQTIQQIRIALNRGQVPLSDMFDGICLVISGATLITPGFLTDTIGFLLLFPPVRNMLRHYIKNHTTWAVSGQSPSQSHQTSQKTGDIIEGEYETMDETTPKS